jgi:hypothetical protein
MKRCDCSSLSGHGGILPDPPLAVEPSFLAISIQTRLA